MYRPTNALSHHDFIQLSQTCKPQRISVSYDAQTPFQLPEFMEEYLPTLRMYWEKESPGLKDFQSIVHMNVVTTRTPNDAEDMFSIHLGYCPASYFQFLFTNYSLDVPLGDQMTLRRILGRNDIRVIGSGPSLPSKGQYEMFAFPKLGNSLGITVSIVTSDQQFIAAKRSESCTSIARDKGNWLCAVGTQIKRHQPRFLNSDGVPHPDLSAQEGLKDEMGQEIAATCGPLICTGIVYRNDFKHCELLYQTESSLRGNDLIRMWKATEVPDRREFAEIQCIDVRSADRLLMHLSDLSNAWSPQHAAGAIHYLASKFPNTMSRFGFSL